MTVNKDSLAILRKVISKLIAVSIGYQKIKRIHCEQESRSKVISQCKPMMNFSHYEVMFHKVQAELGQVSRISIIQELLYIDEMSKKKIRYNSGWKINARMYMIYNTGVGPSFYKR